MISKIDLEKYQTSLANLKVLIIGDIMIDAYMLGDVNRISPEADVNIVDVNKREIRLGGAANVGLNLKSLGCDVGLFGIMAEDHYQDRFLQLIEDAGISKNQLLHLPKRINTVKTRIISNSKHLLRIDEEEIKALDSSELKLAIEKLEQVLEDHWDLILMEDYNKGLLESSFIQKVVELASAKNIPIAVDPKKENILAYKGVSLFKPNLKELGWCLNTDLKKASLGKIAKAGEELRIKLNSKYLLVTLSEQGMLLISEGEVLHKPAHKRNIVDVSGAGDTVISVAATALACGLSAEAILELANLSGGLVCEESGVVPINLNQLLNEARQIS